MINVPTITSSLAAHAARVTPKALQIWFENPAVKLLGHPDREFHKRRRITPIDAVRLAVLGRLVSQWRFTVTEAADILKLSIDRFLGGLGGSGIDGPPWEALDMKMQGLRIAVSRYDGGIFAFCLNSLGSDSRQTADVVLILDVAAIADDVRKRLCA